MVKWTGFGGKAHTREDVGKMRLELGWWLGQWVDGKFPDTQRAGVALIMYEKYRILPLTYFIIVF